MNKRLTIAIVLSALLGVAMLALAVSASTLQKLEQNGLNIHYAKGSPLNGQAFMHISHPQQTLWLDLNWQWCPSLNIARWCVDFTGDTVSGNAKVSTSFSSIYIDDAMVNADAIELILAGFVTTQATVEAHIKQAKLTQAKQLEAIQALDAVLLVSNIDAMGFKFEPHRISAQRDADANFTVDIEGSEANGTALVKSTGQYDANIALTLEPSIAQLLQLPKAADGSLTYKDSGVLPLVAN